MQQISQDTPVSNPDLYERVYRRCRTYLHRMVSLSGVSHQEVEDSCSSIMVRMLAQDGLNAFEGEVTDDRLRYYVAAYFRLGAKAELKRLYRRNERETVGNAPHLVYQDTYFADTSDVLFDELSSLLTGDALTYFQACAEHQNHVQARAFLVSEGWESNRIRNAIRITRATLKKHLCTTS